MNGGTTGGETPASAGCWKQSVAPRGRWGRGAVRGGARVGKGRSGCRSTGSAGGEALARLRLIAGDLPGAVLPHPVALRFVARVTREVAAHDRCLRGDERPSRLVVDVRYLDGDVAV